MKRSALLLVAVVLSCFVVNAQAEYTFAAKKGSKVPFIKVKTDDEEVKEVIQSVISELDDLDYEVTALDTPDSDTTKVVEVQSINTDSGMVMIVTIKDQNGVHTETYSLSGKESDKKKFKQKMREVFKENDDDYKYEFYYFKADSAEENDRVTEDWLMLDIGLNSLLFNGSPSFPVALQNLELDPWKSLHVNVGIFQQKVRLYRKNISLFYGINYDNNDYRFSREIDFKVDATNQISYDTVTTQGFIRNKLTTRFVSIPLGFQFKFNPNARRSFHISLGMHAGYRLTSFFKKVYEDDGKRKKKTRDDFELNNFRYGAFVKVGYGNFTLFGNYVFTPLFRENAGPELNTVSFGLTIGDFLSD
ncbi:MAG TPA: outer membrane beta-barrel protein [Bacteroidia bacterium]|nr:outer membrane beta-barrel protein [Bacteroidia bacterium]